MRFPAAVVLFLMLLQPRAVFAETAQAWGASIPVSSELVTQMQRYDSSGSTIDNAYARRSAAILHSMIFTRVDQIEGYVKTKGCTPSMSVQFPDAGFLASGPNAAKLTSTQSDFEDGFVRVESVSCLAHGTAKEARELFLDPAFRRDAITQVSSYSYSNNRVCEQTKSVLILQSATHSCMHVQLRDQPGSSLLYGQLESNVKDFQPVYYRETATNFIELASGGLAVHSIMYLRAEKLPGIAHGPARSKIAGMQAGAFEALDRLLAAHGRKSSLLGTTDEPLDAVASIDSEASQKQCTSCEAMAGQTVWAGSGRISAL